MYSKNKEIQTKRLLLRNFRENDANECFESWGQDQLLGKYIVLYPMKEIGQMEQFVRSLSVNEDAWVIMSKESESIVGYVTIDIPYEQLGVGEIGYVIGKKYQQHGYAFEAVNCVLKEYLINRNMHLIEAKVNETNTASMKLLEKLGFQMDGRLRDRRIDLQSGNRNDLIIYSITREELLQQP